MATKIRRRKFEVGEDGSETESWKQRRRRAALIIDHYARRGRVIGIYVLHDNPWGRIGEGKGERRRRKSGLNAPWVSFNCYLRGAITLLQGSKGGRREGQGGGSRVRRVDVGRRMGVNGLIYSTNSRQLSGGRDSGSNHADL